jgi:pyruvate formate lyase activating enzyme
MNPDYEIKYQSSLCIECFSCAEACPLGAIVKDKSGRIDREGCNLCMRCVESCPSKALSRVGTEMSVDEVIKPIVSYRPFYEASEKGGMTLSGGEPAFQPQFVLDLLRRCTDLGIHTAMETSGYAKYEVLKSLIGHLNLLLYDIKHMDDELHRRNTGVSNRSTLENLERISKELDIECVIRVPLISGFNDSEKNIEQTSRFVSSLGIKRLDLLPFNELASGKYKSLGLDWEYKRAKRQSKGAMDKYKRTVEAYGLEVTVGGLW